LRSLFLLRLVSRRAYLGQVTGRGSPPADHSEPSEPVV
jgi:hypothetical protein